MVEAADVICKCQVLFTIVLYANNVTSESSEHFSQPVLTSTFTAKGATSALYTVNRIQITHPKTSEILSEIMSDFVLNKHLEI